MSIARINESIFIMNRFIKYTKYVFNYNILFKIIDSIRRQVTHLLIMMRVSVCQILGLFYSLTTEGYEFFYLKTDSRMQKIKEKKELLNKSSFAKHIFL